MTIALYIHLVLSLKVAAINMQAAQEAAALEAAKAQTPIVEPYVAPVYEYDTDDDSESGESYTDDDSEAAAKEWIAERESGGDYDAVSSSGKYIGRYQLSREYLGGDWSVENQEATADEYVRDRYGSWNAAKEHWQAHGWY